MYLREIVELIRKWVDRACMALVGTGLERNAAEDNCSSQAFDQRVKNE